MRRPALAIRHCSWRPGIRLRPSSAWASAHWPDVVFSPGDGPRALLLDDRVEDRFQLVDAELSAIDLAVDDEGRRAGHLDFVGRPLADRHHGVSLRLILEARHRLIVGEASRAHGGDQRLERLVDERPLVLLTEQKLDGGERLVVADAARKQESCNVERVARKFTEDESDLAGVDVVLLQLGKDLAAEGGAMGAGQRAIFDDWHARWVAHRQFGQRTGLEDGRHVHRSIGLGRCAGGASAMRGEGGGGKTREEGKTAKRGEGQIKLLSEGGSQRRTNAHKGFHAASPRSTTPQANFAGLSAARSQARYRLGRRPWPTPPRMLGPRAKISAIEG